MRKTLSRIVSSVDELRATLAEYGDDVLFRGQVRQYTDPDGGLSMRSSFGRHGCVPPHMLKWIHYANSVIRALQGADAPEPAMELSQAILQHYGWRSFYIDATAKAAVAAWFASHVYSSSVAGRLCEDCHEEAALLLVDAAVFLPSAHAQGHIYVIRREALAANGIRCFDLFTEIQSEHRLRFAAQHASIIGPLDSALPERCIVAHIAAPVAVLREFAASAGVVRTADLFPTGEEDPVLKLLLATPWNRLGGAGEPSIPELPAFGRGLRLPQYHIEVAKHLPANVALYSGVWVDDMRRTMESTLQLACFVLVPETYAYGQQMSELRFPRLTEVVRERRVVVIEFDGLLRYAEHHEGTTYNKGVVITATDNAVCVAALIIDHPGMRASGFGVELGWRYTMLPTGMWERRPSRDDCPCNAPYRHLQHICTLQRVEEWFAAGRLPGPDELSVRVQ